MAERREGPCSPGVYKLSSSSRSRPGTHLATPEDDLERFANDNTDAGNALRYCDMFRGHLCYVPEWGWTAWNGKYWETKAQEKPKYMFLKMCDTMKREALAAITAH